MTAVGQEVAGRTVGPIGGMRSTLVVVHRRLLEGGTVLGDLLGDQAGRGSSCLLSALNEKKSREKSKTFSWW